MINNKIVTPQSMISYTPEALNDYTGLSKSADTTYRHIDTDTSVRNSFRRNDYDYFRPEEAVPKEVKKAIQMCMNLYYDEGIIRNIIDLMGDFACQGITLVHPNKRIEQFYQHWFAKVNGVDRSERFLNLLYRTANVVVKSTTAKITKPQSEKLYKSVAEADIEYPVPEKVYKKEIPIKYTFLNPICVEIVDEDVFGLTGKPNYGFKVGYKFKDKIKKLLKTNPELAEQLPQDFRDFIENGKGQILPLDGNKLSVFHYKKDDWQQWAFPFLYSILKDAIMLQKLKLADIAALDGAVSQVRLWTLGDLALGIVPASGSISKLANVLLNNTGGGTIDIIWGPELKFQESTFNLADVLGSEKYDPVLTAIYAGIGVPSTLTGQATQNGYTNNYISLKTLIERLNYGRDVLKSFWDEEIIKIQKAMGFRFPAEIHFDRMTLSDESAEKALLVQLADRGLISVETIQERFGESFNIERIRMQEEEKQRKGGKMGRRAGPWYDPEFPEKLKTTALTNKLTRPEQYEELADLKPASEKPIAEKMVDIAKTKQKEQKLSGIPSQGRPKNKKDSTKRKQKVVKPRSKSFVSVNIWAREAQKTIGEIVNPIFLTAFKKKNLRSLSEAEVNKSELIKFAILCNINPFNTIDSNSVLSIIENPDKTDVPKHIALLYNATIEEFVKKFNKQPTIEDLRQIQASVYSLFVTASTGDE